MCYSAQIEADYRQYVRLFGAHMSLSDFFDLFWRRRHLDDSMMIPKAMEAPFAQAAAGDEERQIKTLIDEFRAGQATKLEQQLFTQKTRLNEAESKLATKPTKTAAESQRIATSKISAALAKLEDLRRPELTREHSRIYPDSYALVMVMENGHRVVKPMRYHCLPAGRPWSFDKQFPGTFNARRDSLGSYWKGVFGVTHGIALWHGFYENVALHRAEGRELGPDKRAANTVLEFRPDSGQVMLVACLWSRWTAPGQPDLLSFAAITDEPPAEVAAAGHDRCIIPLQAPHIDAWLQPDSRNLVAQYAILDDRERPYYEHRLAA